MQDPLGDRMKNQYENRTRFFLPRRTYTIIRVDGKAFHTLTRKLEKPFDLKLINCMNAVALNLPDNLMGSAFSYVQSDECSILLTDFEKEKTEAYFDGNIQKIASVAASMATAYFNKEYYEQYGEMAVAQFDARVFTIPDPAEVANYFIWRQADATRNSIQMVAQSLYSHKELHGKNWGELNELIFQKNVNFDDFDSHFKRGRVVIKTINSKETLNLKTNKSEITHRSSWEILEHTPWFTKEKWFLKNLIPQYDC